MRILNKEVDSVFFFIIVFILIFIGGFFINYPVWEEMPLPYLILILIALALTTDSNYILKSKDKTGKIVGDNNVKHSVLSAYYYDFGSYRAYGLGGYIHELLGIVKKSSQGVVIGHPSLFKQVGENIKLLGPTRRIHVNHLSIEDVSQLKNYFGYNIEYVFQVLPPKEFSELKIDEQKFVYLDLLSELDNKNILSNSRKKLIEGIGSDITTFADKSSAVMSRFLRPFNERKNKKLIEDNNK